MDFMSQCLQRPLGEKLIWYLAYKDSRLASDHGNFLTDSGTLGYLEVHWEENNLSKSLITACKVWWWVPGVASRSPI